MQNHFFTISDNPLFALTRDTRTRRALTAYYSNTRYQSLIKAVTNIKYALYYKIQDYLGLIKEFEDFDKTSGHPDRVLYKVSDDNTFDVYDINYPTEESIPTVEANSIYNALQDIVNTLQTMFDSADAEEKEIEKVGLSMDIFDFKYDALLNPYVVPDFGWVFFHPLQK